MEDLESIKKQLLDIAPVVNAFKSEAVQLRVVESLLSQMSFEPSQEVKQHKPGKKAKAKAPKKQAKAAGKGPIALLNKIYEQGFFNKPKTIAEIVSHCEVNEAKKIKQTDISGKLARMVRDGQLRRNKNAESQYEYKKA